MGVGIENLPLLQKAEEIADAMWKHVNGWTRFEKDTVERHSYPQIAQIAQVLNCFFCGNLRQSVDEQETPESSKDLNGYINYRRAKRRNS